MNILIVGPGAMGCLFAARFNQAGHDVTILDYIVERAEKISEQGIVVDGVTGKYTASVPTVTDRISGPPDVVFICVKANQTEEAAQKVKGLTEADTTIVTLQNGIGNIEILRNLFGEKSVLGGVTAEGATLIEWGKIIHAGQGDTIIGSSVSSDIRLEKLISAFNDAGFNTKKSDNVDNLLWGKLIINVGINALTAITRLKNGRLPDLDGTRLIMEEAVKEAVSVAKAKGISLPYPDPIGRVIEVCRATSGNIASMLQDVLKKKITEVDFINGAIVQEGKASGIPTPINLTLTSLIHAIQTSYNERL